LGGKRCLDFETKTYCSKSLINWLDFVVYVFKIIKEWMMMMVQDEDKMKLSEATGLDQKQINNWFINQRKRHWKPSEDMRFALMEGAISSSGGGHVYFDTGGGGGSDDI
jgi:hypothetical protein